MVPLKYYVVTISLKSIDQILVWYEMINLKKVPVILKMDNLNLYLPDPLSIHSKRII